MKNAKINDVSVEKKSAIKSVASYANELMHTGPTGMAGKGMEFGVSTILGRTVLKSLPAPLNFVAPFLIEKVIMKHGAEEGRDLLIKGLKWIKHMTDEKEEV
jgi:hypothetical protein